MTDRSDLRSHTGSLPVEQWDALDRVCDRFELAWQFDERPKLEDFLSDVEAEVRESLFRLLLELEIEYRRRAGEPIAADDYRDRYPAWSSVIDDVLAAPSPRASVASIETVAYESTGTEAPSQPDTPPVSPPPAQIGRFRITREIGKGGFGTVFAGFDTELQREVAIKVSAVGRTRSGPDLQLVEAQVAASLDHPGIVPVLDVGRLPTGRLYLVSKLIPGCDLRTRMREFPFGICEAATLIREVAEALHSAHERGIVHRDVKPENILLDARRSPHLTDFGLALRSSEAGSGAAFVGTTSYMSPEQARGEGHLVDARSDIFSLSIVLYELLTGIRPFQGTTPDETLKNIQAAAPVPPSSHRRDVPAELDRITLKGLARLAGDRYASADGLAKDLQHWLQTGQPESAPACSQLVVPRGLRPFEIEDAHFYRRLVPGPRSRDGMPEAIAFWKSRMESRSGDRAFRIGVLYGPSGAGKTSLIAAGILPALDSSIHRCLVRTSATGTAQAWLTTIRRLLPAYQRATDLVDVMQTLRSGQGIFRNDKLLVVLDPFESCLTDPQPPDAEQLVSALRQCDGTHIQALLVVRDDSWTRLTRWLRQLDISLDGGNSRAVEPFHADHARRVLAELGMGYGRWTESDVGASRDAMAFVDRVVRELSEIGNILPVQLAIVAERFRNQPWSRAELQRAGGVRGAMGLYFDSVLKGNLAHPILKRHADAAIEVISSLVPPSGTPWTEHRRTVDQLGESVGPHDAPLVPAILEVLEQEYRLVTLRCESEEDDPASKGAHPGQNQVDGLGPQTTVTFAHEFLVPMVRDWVDRRRRSTFRGRAERLLTDRTETWQAHPVRRNLPSMGEWLAIHAFARRPAHGSAARALLASSNRWYLGTALLAAATIWLIVAGFRTFVDHRTTQGLVRSLLTSETSELPAIISAIQVGPPTAIPRIADTLQQRLVEHGPDDVRLAERELRRRFNLRVALLPSDAVQLPAVAGALGLNAADSPKLPIKPSEIGILAGLLRPRRDELIPLLRQWVQETLPEHSELLLRRTAFWALLEPDRDWQGESERIADSLLSVPRHQLKTWLELFAPAAPELVPVFLSRLGADTLPDRQVNLAESIAHFAADDVDTIAEAAVAAGPSALSILLPVLQRHPARASSRLRASWEQLARPVEAVLPQFPPIDPQVAEQLTHADGASSPTAAFAMSVDMNDSQALLLGMGKAGYRPNCFRPYGNQGRVSVALSWLRDGYPWQVQSDLSAEDLRALKPLDGTVPMQLVDVTCFAPDESVPADVRYAVLWSAAPADAFPTQFDIDLTWMDHKIQWVTRYDEHCYPLRVHMRQDAKGVPHFTVLWRQLQEGPRFQFNQFGTWVRDFEYSYGSAVLLDCQLSPLDLSLTDDYKSTHYCVDYLPSVGPDRDANLQMALRYLQNNRLDDAAHLADELVAVDPSDPDYVANRARVACARGDVELMKSEIERLEQLGGPKESIAMLRLRLAARLGHVEDIRSQLSILEQPSAQADETSLASFRSRLAKACSVAADALRTRDQVQSLELEAKALQALNVLERQHLKEFIGDRDSAGLRRNRQFKELLDHEGFAAWCTGAWDGMPRNINVDFVNDRELPQQLARARELLELGYYAASLSAVRIDATGRILTTSVWHLRTNDVAGDFQRDSRLANSALGLFLLGDHEPILDILADRKGRQARSLVVERLRSVDMAPQKLAAVWWNALDALGQRNALLALGHVLDTWPDSAGRQGLATDIQRVMAATQDAGLRQAGRWCLGRWGRKSPEILMNQPNVASAVPAPFYRNSIGQVMVQVRPGEKNREYFIGSHGVEIGRNSFETPSLRQLHAAYYLAATEVTCEQFQQFLNDPRVVRAYARTTGLPRVDSNEPRQPRTSIVYADAVRFCQWLSERDGIPEREWCYPGVLEGMAEGYRAPADLLLRKGYRLPTEAELEFACRAGSTSSRSFGETEQVLGAYAWTNANSGGAPHPVGLLKPNDWGFFDLLGNAGELCHDGYHIYYETEDPLGSDMVLAESVPRVSRGGSYLQPPSAARSASRMVLSPAEPRTDLGFRLARTIQVSEPD